MDSWIYYKTMKLKLGSTMIFSSVMVNNHSFLAAVFF